MGSPASQVLRGAPTPPRPSPSPLVSLGAVYLRPVRFVRSGWPPARGGCHPAWSGSPLDLRGVDVEGGGEASQVPGGPCADVPCSLTPVGPRRPAILAPRCCLPPRQRRRPPRVAFRGSITRPACSLPTLHADGRPPPRTAHFRVAASLARAGLDTCWVPSRGFSSASYVTSSSPRLRLAHCRNLRSGPRST